ncbi:MAG: hypothetical protein ACYC7A_22645 [Thermoanaerobaculia bacterium]
MTIRSVILSLIIAAASATTWSQESPFGFHPGAVSRAGYWNNGFGDAEQIGVGWTREVVYAFWFLVQPDLAKRQYDFTRYDQQYARVPTTIRILANVAPEGPIHEGYCRPGTYLPIDEAQYCEFVKAVVERYDGDGVEDMPGLTNPIAHWQVGNEPVSTKPGFAELQRITYLAIKEACETCVVLIGGVPGMPPAATYLADFDRQYRPILDALGGRYVDVVDVHWYGNATGDYRGVRDVIDHVRTVLAADGFGSIPIWITEMGTYSGDPVERGRNQIDFPFQTEREQALDLVKRFVYPLSLGVKKVFPAFGLMEGFKFDGGYFDFTGLIHDGWGPHDHGMGVRKLGWYSHKKMTEMLEGADWTSAVVIQDSENIVVCRVQRNDRPLYVVWWDYFNDRSFAPGTTREFRLTGLPATVAQVTELVPAASSGTDVDDYSTAFRRDRLTVDAGALALTLTDSPVIVELLPSTKRRAVSR